jgi:hypothetical protein
MCGVCQQGYLTQIAGSHGARTEKWMEARISARTPAQLVERTRSAGKIQPVFYFSNAVF